MGSQFAQTPDMKRAGKSRCWLTICGASIAFACASSVGPSEPRLDGDAGAIAPSTADAAAGGQAGVSQTQNEIGGASPGGSAGALGVGSEAGAESEPPESDAAAK